MAKQLEITYVKSVASRPEYERRVMRALGLRRLHQTVVREDAPWVRGMIQRVRHLVEVKEVPEGTGEGQEIERA